MPFQPFDIPESVSFVLRGEHPSQVLASLLHEADLDEVNINLIDKKVSHKKPEKVVIRSGDWSAPNEVIQKPTRHAIRSAVETRNKRQAFYQDQKDRVSMDNLLRGQALLQPARLVAKLGAVTLPPHTGMVASIVDRAIGSLPVPSRDMAADPKARKEFLRTYPTLKGKISKVLRDESGHSTSSVLRSLIIGA